MSPDDLLAHLAAEQDRFLGLATTADPHRPVAACAPWTVADLLAHLTGIHRWAAVCAALRPTADLPDDEAFAAPAGAGEYARAAADLRAALTADPQRPCATLTGPGTASWWARRQLHETLVHRWDLESALGGAAELDPRIAADCVAEVVDTMQPRQMRLGRMPALRDGIRLQAPGREWLVGEQAVAEVTGPAPALALLLWRRIPLDDRRLAVTGDRAAAAAALALPLTP
ncbi:maleylpyruvate isomerase family mycothiol-dependent enzyme [Blastococcus sp. SYSU D00820]